MRRCLVAALLGCTLCSCGIDIDLASDYGYHDFGWNLSQYDARWDGSRQPSRMLWGFVQTRPDNDHDAEPLYAICALSDIQGLGGNWDIERDKHGRFVGYQGHGFEMRPKHKAIYALQEDGSLQEIVLSAE